MTLSTETCVKTTNNQPFKISFAANQDYLKVKEARSNSESTECVSELTVLRRISQSVTKFS